MKTLFTLLLATLCAATGYGQTIRSLGYNTTNGHVVYAGTNVLTFTNNVNFASGNVQFYGTQIVGNGLYIDFDDGAIGGGVITLNTNSAIAFEGSAAATTRTNLGLGKFSVSDDDIAGIFGETKTALQVDGDDLQINVPISFFGTNTASTTRTNLGLGGGITTNRTFVSYNGTNYTTNSVSISNGVITGWTQ
jgi:hypothetical protein